MASRANFDAVFSFLGFSPCDQGDVEEGWVKIALYLDASGIPTHAARQIGPDEWTSKLGRSVDISHTQPEDLFGPGYGQAVTFFRRRRMANESL